MLSRNCQEMVMSGLDRLAVEPVDETERVKGRPIDQLACDREQDNWIVGSKQSGPGKDTSLTQILGSETGRHFKDNSTADNIQVAVKNIEMISGKNWKEISSEVGDDQSESDQEVNVTDDENLTGEGGEVVGEKCQTYNSERSGDAELLSCGDLKEKDKTSSSPKRLDVSPGESVVPDKTAIENGVSEDKDILSPNQKTESQLKYEDKQRHEEVGPSDHPRQIISDEVFASLPPHYFHQQQLLLSPEERILMNRCRMPLSVLQLHQQQQYHHHQQQQPQLHHHQQEQQQNGYLDLLYRRHLENMYRGMRGRALQASPPPASSSSPPRSDNPGGEPQQSSRPSSLWEVERPQTPHTGLKSRYVDTAQSLRGKDSDSLSRHASPLDPLRLSPTPEKSKEDCFSRDPSNCSDSPSSRKRQITSPEVSVDDGKCQKLHSMESRSRAVSPETPPSTQPLLASSVHTPGPTNQISSRHPTAYSLPSSLISPTTSRPKSSSPEIATYSVPHRPWNPAPSPAKRQTPQKEENDDVTNAARSASWCDITLETGAPPGVERALGMAALDDDDIQGEVRGGSPGLNCSPSSSPERLKHGENYTAF